ncbi:replication restart helicase PriA [Psychrobacter sp. I-STPA10]|uniref:replication restart helicase PriA n=1 Tax=Psychrobacter sp. I-STPA10 TaxID=2585769 RepID=UPI001E4F9826|nr:primosomal protein N' [Psychrobacter sp. I-STPA10]
MLISVALPVPLYRVFDYLAPSNAVLPSIGSRVQVSFGRQTLIGIVVAYVNANDCPIDPAKLKPIKQVLDDEPLVDKPMLNLARWLARYYHYPLGDVLAVMLPTLIRQGKPLDLLIRHWRILPHVTEDDFHSNAKKQKQQFAMLKLHGKHGASEDTLLMEGMQRPFLKRLEDNGLIEHYFEHKPAPPPISLAKLPLDLNDEQETAVQQIYHACEQNQYQGFLLNGVTGSGKTEVYLQAMQPVLEAGKQVLVLVPEIGLTPQTKARFANRFAASILLLHSGLNNSQRMQGWQDCRQGHAQIIIGTRSTLLYPFANLGLIIVDEAHDLSYKQQDTLRYHAADVALYRGYQLGIVVILGTATPSLEQFKLVDDGKLTELRLSKRAGHAIAASLQLVDARLASTQHSSLPSPSDSTNTSNSHNSQNNSQNNSQTKTGQQLSMNLPDTTKSIHGKNKNSASNANAVGISKQSQDTGLTDGVITAIRRTLEAGNQVLVFLNRRGYAPILLCSACGWQADCPRCEAHLTVHHSQLEQQKPSYLKCHHCDWQTNIAKVCPDCSSPNLDPVGIGTTRLSESLHAIFSNPQTSKTIYPIIQIDRDTTRRKDSWENIYQRINQGKPAILVGTQMVAKGHHFPNVTLVVLPNADRGFLSADFRSPEHTAQLIIQVAGRAGRGDKAGKVLIQTLQPDNPLLLKLVKDGYIEFSLALLEERRLMGLPPYTHAALIRCEGKSIERTTQLLTDAIAILPKPNQLAILGPIDAPMRKKNSRYQSQLLLLSQSRPHLHQILQQWWTHVLQLPAAKYLKLTLDIDPVGW